MPSPPRPPFRIRTLRIGPLGCVLFLAVAFALVYLLLPLFILLAALPVAFVLFLWARTKIFDALGIRHERCPGCGGRLSVKRNVESVTCRGCGMIHVFAARESAEEEPARLPGSPRGDDGDEEDR